MRILTILSLATLFLTALVLAQSGRQIHDAKSLVSSGTVHQDRTTEHVHNEPRPPRLLHLRCGAW
jgi:hypothetical protein